MNRSSMKYMLDGLTRQMEAQLLGAVTTTATATTTQTEPLSFDDIKRNFEQLQKQRHFIIHAKKADNGKWKPDPIIFSMIREIPMKPNPFFAEFPEESESNIIQAMGATWYLSQFIGEGVIYEIDAPAPLFPMRDK